MSPPAAFDLLVVNARIVDGSGSASFRGSVAVHGDRITAVLPPDAPEPGTLRRVDALGRVLAPGFVDVHTHADATPFVEPWMDSFLRQGVTTVVVGNCGWSAFPPEGALEVAALAGAEPGAFEATWSSFGAYLEAIDRARPALNVAALVGHGMLRASALGDDQRRPPSAEEAARMRELLGSALDDGAVGLSSGLIYPPGLHATTEEIVGLARALRAHGGVYASHVRGEGPSVFRAVAECIEVGRRAEVPAHVSHLKVEGRTMWGSTGRLLELLDSERASGADVTADQYPYTAWETELAAALPPWVTPSELPDVLADPDGAERLQRSIEDGEPGWESVARELGWDRIVLGSFVPDPSLAGRTIASLAAERGQPPASLIASLLLQDRYAAMLGHGMDEDDVRTIAARPEVFVASDGLAVSPEGPLGRSLVHPRCYGTFARVLARYVREERALTLEQAVRKMSALPAERFGLAGRGRIEIDAAADLVLLDPDTVADRATYEAPHAYAEGVDLVVVNGRIAWDGQRRDRAGRALRRGER